MSYSTRIFRHPEGNTLSKISLKQLWRNEYFQTAVTIVLVVVVVFGFWYGSKWALRTDYPALAVASGSMCMLSGPYCDGWSHPFERTLHVGDLIIVQGVPPESIHAAPYPDGDIIVFHSEAFYGGGELIVHRAIAKTVDTNGQIFFTTKGDGNSREDSTPVREDQVVGRVIMRVPWLGHLALLVHDSSGMLIIVSLIIILIIVEFIFPMFTKKEPEAEPKKSAEKASET
jgi:signal peptidase